MPGQASTFLMYLVLRVYERRLRACVKCEMADTSLVNNEINI